MYRPSCFRLATAGRPWTQSAVDLLSRAVREVVARVAIAGGVAAGSPDRGVQVRGIASRRCGTGRAMRGGVGFWDDLGKDLLASVLEAAGVVVETEREVRTRAQRVDCWVVSPAKATATAGAPALLLRMTGEPCAFEIVSRALNSDDVLNGMRKMLNVAQTREDGRRLLANFAPLWVISAGYPKTALTTLAARPMEDWPSGFHEVPGPLPVRIVVVPELPRDEETRWLRLLGTGETLFQALAEVRIVRQPSPSARAIWRVVFAYGRELERRRGKLSAEEKEFLMRKDIAERFDAWERAQRRDTLEEVLSRQLERRFGALSAPVRRKLAKASAADLDQWVDRVVTADSIAAVFDEV